MFCDAGKALASRPSLATRFAALRASQGALLVAHVTQALAQHLEVIRPGVINFGMVTAQDDLVLVVAEDAALEFARYRHGFLEDRTVEISANMRTLSGGKCTILSRCFSRRSRGSRVKSALDPPLTGSLPPRSHSSSRANLARLRSPPARLVAQRRQAGKRIGKARLGARRQRQQRRARLAAVAAHGAQRRLEAGGTVGLEELVQGRDLVLRRARREKFFLAAQVVEFSHQARRDRGQW